MQAFSSTALCEYRSLSFVFSATHAFTEGLLCFLFRVTLFRHVSGVSVSLEHAVWMGP